MVRVTVTDPATGESETKEIHNDFVIVCDGRVYVDSAQRHRNGTTVLTVKTDGPAPSDEQGGRS